MLELSLREALQLGHNYIGTEHLLLGLIREGDGVAAQVLIRLGREEWTAKHPALPVLAERVQRLADGTERLRALLRQHGIDPQDKPA